MKTKLFHFLLTVLSIFVLFHTNTSKSEITLILDMDVNTCPNFGYGPIWTMSLYDENASPICIENVNVDFKHSYVWTVDCLEDGRYYYWGGCASWGWCCRGESFQVHDDGTYYYLFTCSTSNCWAEGPIYRIQKLPSTDNEGVSAGYTLEQNYPNPFNPVTNVHFSIPKDGKVTFKVYNSLGQLVDTYLDGFVKAGKYNAEIDASNWASGVYFYTLSAGDFVQTKKMILVK